MPKQGRDMVLSEHPDNSPCCNFSVDSLFYSSSSRKVPAFRVGLQPPLFCTQKYKYLLCVTEAPTQCHFVMGLIYSLYQLYVLCLCTNFSALPCTNEQIQKYTDTSLFLPLSLYPSSLSPISLSSPSFLGFLSRSGLGESRP